MREFMSIAKALADENRVRVLMFPRGGELCVCQIIEMLQLAPSTVSKHLAILRQVGLIDSGKEGRWVYHRLPEERSELVEDALKWVHDSLARSKSTLKDERELKRVKETCLEELCNHYSNSAREAA